MDDEAVDETILRLTAQRGPGRTICPSEAARALADDWRPLMGQVRDRAGVLLDAGRIAVTQGGQDVDPRTARGPLRLGVGRG